VNISFVKFWFLDWRAYVAEFLGTLCFVFISSALVVSDIFFGNLGVLGISLGIGLSYCALIFLTAHLSGGFLNPAVTVALWLSQKLTGVKTIFFLIAQITASFASAGLVFLVFGQEAQKFGLGTPVVGFDLAPDVAIILEAFLTAVLIFVIFGTMIDRAGPVSFGPLAIGLVLFALTILDLPLSGASLNPVRAIGPATVSGKTLDLALFIVGPLGGSLFGPIYSLIFLKRAKSR